MGKVRGESLDSLKFTNLILYSMFVSIYLSSIIFHSSQVDIIEKKNVADEEKAKRCSHQDQDSSVPNRKPAPTSLVSRNKISCEQKP